MKRASFLLVLIGTIVFAILPLKAVASYDPDRWRYKVKVVVSNPTSNTRTNYPVRIDIPAKLYIDAGRMNSDLRDIRFSDIDGNKLHFWIHISEGMMRKVNNLPVYVRLNTLRPGNNMVFLHFDNRRSKTDDPPSVPYDGDFNPATHTPQRTCYPTSGDFPYSHDNCGNRVFNLFAFTSRDSGDWNFSGTFGSTNERWVSRNRFSNNLCFHYRFHGYFTHLRGTPAEGPEMHTYFLTQVPAGHSPDPAVLPNYNGYRLFMNYVSRESDNYRHNRARYCLQIQRNQSNGGNIWTTLGGFVWHPYNNSIQDFDIKVTSTRIEIWINGRMIGGINRDDNFNGGHVGIDRLNSSEDGECGSNSMDGISPMWVIDNYIGQDPVAQVLGQADLEIRRVKPTFDPAYIGRDIIEVLPKKQILQDKVTETSLEQYVYSTYTMADLNNQVFRYKLKIRNRGDDPHTFDINLNVPVGDIGKGWFIAYSYAGSGGWVYKLPDDDPLDCDDPSCNNPSCNNPSHRGSTLYRGDKNIAAGAGWEMDIFVMPSDRALFQRGGLGRSILEFEVKSRGDLSFDIAKFISNIVPRPDCSYWKYKLPITIRYNDTNGTGDLIDYQVLVNLRRITNLDQAQEDGDDIVFLDEDGSSVPFWIKSFNRRAGSGSFWVKVPRIPSGNPGTKTIYMFWGNPDYPGGRSSLEETFDLWEDWQARALDTVVGCPDGTTDCSGASADPDGWENIPTPDDNYNWWRIRNRLDGEKALMADRGSSFVSSDIGPFIVGGDVRWGSYEVIYSFYGEYCNYSGCNRPWSNPQYNPVFYQDAGNNWGIEFFADMFIFRPFSHGTDWTWIYQSYPRNILGESFPANHRRYWVKIRLFNNPKDNRTYLRILSTRANVHPADIDSDDGFIEITEEPGIGYVADPAFSLSGGSIGFGGWNGGFSFDNIRVRKYTVPEPTVSVGCTKEVTVKTIRSLSFPTLTPPLMDGRPVLLRGDLTPWKWFGNLIALYADCLIAGDCLTGEDKRRPGTISLWGKIDSNTPKGAGDHLMERTADSRRIFTAYESNDADTKIQGDAERLNFDVSNASVLRPLLGVGTLTEAENLIKFVRGKYIAGYSRSDTRSTDGSQAESKQWKLGDVIHSSPLIVGVPNMGYADPDYWKRFVKENRKRDLVAYFGSNEGMVHAVRLARFDDAKKRYVSDTTAEELWAFIPNEILPRLRDTTDDLHEYLTDGLLRAIDVKFLGEADYKTILMVGLRTGGRSLLCLDVTKPATPKLLWEINSTTNLSEFEKIGETYSTAALGRLRRFGNDCDPWVAILGSGLDPYDPKSLSKRAYLSVVDLKDGSIIKQLEISDKRANLITDMAVLRDQNGYLEKVYFGDHYGALWRIDLSTTRKVDNFMGKTRLVETEDMLFKPFDYEISDIGANPPVFPKRPISSQPRYAMAEDNVLWVYFGTGSYGMYDPNYPHQRFYGLKDNVTTPYLDAILVDMTSSNNYNLGEDSWYIELGRSDDRDYEFSGGRWVKSTKDRNERVLTTPEVYGGYVFFTTFTPNNSPCGGGATRFYGLGYKTGRYRNNLIKGIFDNQGQKTDVRSVIPSEPFSARDAVPSRPFIYVGEDRAGNPVAKGLVNLGTGEMAEIRLNTQLFTEMVNILLWREIR